MMTSQSLSVKVMQGRDRRHLPVGRIPHASNRCNRYHHLFVSLSSGRQFSETSPPQHFPMNPKRHSSGKNWYFR